MIGLKFGGATLGNAEMMGKSADIVAASYRNDEKPIVVVSAMKGDIAVTQYLRDAVRRAVRGEDICNIISPLEAFHYKTAEALGVDAKLEDDFSNLEKTLAATRLYNKEEEDKNIIYGERLSSKIFSALLRKKGIPSNAYNAADVGMLTDSEFGNANPLPEAYPLLGNNLAWNNDEVKVVTGFEGITRDKRYTTLGSNSSDLTIAVICAGIDEYSNKHTVGKINIYKDTIMMTADPKIVPKALPVREISYNEMAEGGYYASRVIHPHAIDSAKKRGVPIRIMDFSNPEDEGTLITNSSYLAPHVVKFISYNPAEYLFTVEFFEERDKPGVLSRMFDVFGQEEIKTSINIIAGSATRVTLTTSENRQDGNIEKITNALCGMYGEKRVIFKELSYIAVVGEGMQQIPGVARRIAGALADDNINIEVITQPMGELTGVYFVAPEDNQNALRAVHREFFEKS